MKRRLWAAAVIVAVVSGAIGTRLALVRRRVSPSVQPIVQPPVPPPPDPQGIVIHHSATPGAVRGNFIGAAQISAMHKKRGFSVHYRGKLYHIGYHYVIRENGTIESGRPEHCIGAHAKITEYNHYLGICLIGNFSQGANRRRYEPSVPTGQQLRSLVWLCSELSEKYHFPTSHIIRHRDIRQTACPGENFPYHWLLWEVDQFRPVVHAHMAQIAAKQTGKGAGVGRRAGEPRLDAQRQWRGPVPGGVGSPSYSLLSTPTPVGKRQGE